MKNRLSGRVCAAWAATFGRASSIVIRELVRPHNRCRWFGNTVNMKKQITVRGLSSTTDVRTCVLTPVVPGTVKPWGWARDNDPVSNVSATIARVRGPAHAPPPALPVPERTLMT